MSSSNAALGTLLTAALTLAANPQSCPPAQRTHRLTAVQVFDGPPAERADLVPDISQGVNAHAYASWNVASIYTAGRHVFLTCTYGPITQKLILELPTKVDRCIYRTHHKRRSLTCK